MTKQNHSNMLTMLINERASRIALTRVYGTTVWTYAEHNIFLNIHTEQLFIGTPACGMINDLHVGCL
jgi:hypothetical protein